MIIAKCPLRISLVGGSTDLQASIEKYGYGAVISFPCNLYTYITINERYDNFYRINYSKTETVKSKKEIQNDVCREVLEHFEVPPVTVSFNCDISSSGSGLAASSSYLLSMIKAVSEFMKIELSQYEICKLALEIERRFNPLTGYQDTYGCGIGGFKKLQFNLKETEVDVECCFLSTEIFKKTNMYLVPTNIVRSSTGILSTLDLEKIGALYEDVKDLYANIGNESSFYGVINRAWQKKKETSSSITSTEILEIESRLKTHYNIDAMKLCGAGGGGYFLIFTRDEIKEGSKIRIDNEGVKAWTI